MRDAFASVAVGAIGFIGFADASIAVPALPDGLKDLSISFALCWLFWHVLKHVQFVTNTFTAQVTTLMTNFTSQVQAMDAKRDASESARIKAVDDLHARCHATHDSMRAIILDNTRLLGAAQSSLDRCNSCAGVRETEA